MFSWLVGYLRLCERDFGVLSDLGFWLLYFGLRVLFVFSFCLGDSGVLFDCFDLWFD